MTDPMTFKSPSDASSPEAGRIYQTEPGRPTSLYVVSATRFAETWRILSAAGVTFTSSWFLRDRAPHELTLQLGELATRTLEEIARADAFLWYGVERVAGDRLGDAPLAALGAAIALKKPCMLVGSPRSTVGSNLFSFHPLVSRRGTLREGLKECGINFTDPMPTWMPEE
jgi:hypothetical protein